MCLAHGKREPSTWQALRWIQKEGILDAASAAALIDPYRHLRQVEGVLRRWSLEGEIELPADDAAYLRVAIRRGHASADAFRTALAAWRTAIRGVYDKVFS
jgi:glutamine synthetase adenylyltransferase